MRSLQIILNQIENPKIPYVYAASADLDEASWLKIFEVLSINTNTIYIDLRGNNFTDKVAAEIGNMLTGNHTLTDLRLNRCGLSDEGGVLIANALKINSSLRVLKMDDNPIGDITGKEFADTLRTNHGLRELSFQNCKNITDRSAVGITTALKGNYFLKKLNLCNTSITDLSADAFAELIISNHILNILNLVGTSISDWGLQRIVDASWYNCTIIDLEIGPDLTRGPIAAYILESLAKSLEHNKSLVENFVSFTHTELMPVASLSSATISKADKYFKLSQVFDEKLLQDSLRQLDYSIEDINAFKMKLKNYIIENTKDCYKSYIKHTPGLDSIVLDYLGPDSLWSFHNGVTEYSTIELCQAATLEHTDLLGMHTLMGS